MGCRRRVFDHFSVLLSVLLLVYIVFECFLFCDNLYFPLLCPCLSSLDRICASVEILPAFEKDGILVHSSDSVLCLLYE